MNQIPVLNYQDFIAADGDQLFTTSRQVAAVFGKRHDRVMRAVRDLCAKLPQDRLLNFGETVEMRANPSGGALIPSLGYQLTRTGFTLLAMRFTGKKALAFQLAYIDAFDAMAAHIKNQRDGLRYR
ncbi:MAG: Rha family transcriptional regulator, partial [Herbaspirillum sp.]